jgi:hypothetical protein
VKVGPLIRQAAKDVENGLQDTSKALKQTRPQKNCGPVRAAP